MNLNLARRDIDIDDEGFSVAELLVASVLVLLVIGGMLALVAPAGQAAHAQPEAIDMQQRVRFGADALFRALHGAGAGLDAGPLVGPLAGWIPPILPRRIGALDPEPPTTARSDVISLLRVPGGPVQTTLVAPFSTSLMVVREEPGCPPGQPACGIKEGMGLLVFDRAGHMDLFTAQFVSGPGAALRKRGPSLPHAYEDGAFIAEVEGSTYYLDAAARQLRHYDTDLTDAPVMDDVTGLGFEYFGAGAPPWTPRPPAGEASCLYGAAGDLLPGLTVLPAGSDSLALLPLDLFTDGPWCGAGDLLFDADLLRIRRIRVTLRVQASTEGFRGTGARFSAPGSSRSVWRTLPDVMVTFDVAPRNMNLGH
jgi:hypothetical protein